MRRIHVVLRTFGILALLAVATLALPLAAHAGVRVSIGIGVPIYPAPVLSPHRQPSCILLRPWS